MAITYHADNSDRLNVSEIGTNTNRRDVSDMLDLWAHKETPFLNRLKWGEESGGTQVEWISEHLGYGYVVIGSVVASGALSIAFTTGGGAASLAEAAKMINTGALLFGYSSTDAEIMLLLVDDVAATGTLAVNYLLPSTSSALSLASTDRLYVLGQVAGDGSLPRTDVSRARSVLTNNMTILRKDVQITGSMMATDMYAVENELQHQIQMRLKEMQREREMMSLLAISQTAASTAAGILNGCFGFLEGQETNSEYIKVTAQAFTEDTVNDVCAELYDNGSTPNVLVGATAQIRKFTDWDRARVRTAPDNKLGGFHVTKYLTDTGIEIDLIPMRKFPTHIAFLLDTEKIELKAKKGRKLIVEKLGKAGDFDQWQMISEFSMIMRGYDKGQHGMWSALTP